MRICVMAPHFIPAHKAGGPVPGIVGVLDTMEEHDVHVVTSDRDLGDTHAFPEPYRGTTVLAGNTVTYLPPLGLGTAHSWWLALWVLRSADVVYLNSVMSKGFAVLPLLLLWATGYRGRLVISPRGELARTALTLGGSRQKRAWSWLIRVLGLHRRLRRRGPRVVWAASSDRERIDIEAAFDGVVVATVPERLRRPTSPTLDISRDWDVLRVVSVGRIAPVKGTEDLVRGLQYVRGNAHVQLVGLEEDLAYLELVRGISASLPPHVQLDIVGAVPPQQVEELVARARLFVLLSHGENFGHAIGEALRGGCPVLISDQTPWSFVAERRAGVVLNPAECRDPRAVAKAVDHFAAMSLGEWREWSVRATAAAEPDSDVPTLLQAVEELTGPGASRR